LESLEAKMDQLLSILAPQAPKTKKVIAKKPETTEVVETPTEVPVNMQAEESDELTAQDLLDMETLGKASSKPSKAKKEKTE